MANYYTVLDTLKTNLENDSFVNTVTQGDIFGVAKLLNTGLEYC